MKLLIVLVSGDPHLRKFLERRKQGVVPAGALGGGYLAGRKPVVDTRTYAVGPTSSPRDLELFVQRACADAEGFFVLYEAGAVRLVEGLKQAALLSPFDPAEAQRNPENLLQREIARGLRNLSLLGTHMGKGDEQKILLLPLRNFHAQELVVLQGLVHDHARLITFADQLEKALAEFRRTRQRPKPAKRRRGKFLVDDRERFFEYGLERHARVSTDPKTHRLSCALNSRFRFGLRYDDERHFNVSFEGENDAFEGEIDNCHEDRVHLKRKKHLNLFPNGYYE
jgi:hypothetical protein